MDILTEVYHLQELPHYASEKPYTMRYVPEGPIAVSNVFREKHVVEVTDMRRGEGGYCLDKHGFMVLKLETKMMYEDYDHDKITDVYLQELEGVLREHFPKSTIDFVTYLIRKREVSFPYSTGERYSFGQPNIVAHIDATPAELMRQIRRRHGPDAERILKGRCQYITIWKPLRGPLYDWPLALCDGSSVDAEKDLEPQDIVDRDEVLENVHVYHRPHHRWHYLSEQQDSELLVFRQADTRQGSFGTPHCAIAIPGASKGYLPRESIEVVAFMYSSE